MSVEDTAASPRPGNRRIDRVLAADYLEGLQGLPLAEVRSLRADAEQEEVDLSYLRRIIQGRLDILRAELNRRDGTGSPDLVQGLAAILADEPRAPARGLGRHTTMEPSRADSHRRYVEALAADVDLSDVSARSTDELAHAMRTLSEEETGLSAKRREVQQVMDACGAEITRRYRDGEADVDTLLGQQPGAPQVVTAPVLVELVRSGVVESVHRASVLAVRADGTDALALGEVDRPVLPRSSNKPLQAVGLLDAGWEPPDDESLALATASHSGEAAHLAVVRRTLAAAGLDESALGCPAMLPLSEPAAHALLRSGGAASRLTMNCSGKHAAMLATCVARGWPVGGYLDPQAPVQQALTATLERLAGEPVQHVAVDGCGAPQHALSLRGLARAFTALATGDGACRRTAAAMTARPDLVGGTGREVTDLMAGVPGLVAKDGAEGVFAAALPDGAAVAVKVVDGATRAAVPVLVAGLRALGVEGDVLERLGTTPVLGGGVPVGELRPAAALLTGDRAT